MTEQTFNTLSEEFRASAQAHKADSEAMPMPMLITKYLILQRHKLTDCAEKDSVADTLFECAMDIVRPFLSKKPKDVYFSDGFAGEFSSVVSKLLAPESADHIPARASSVLADTALDLLRRGEQVTVDDFPDRDGRTNYNDYREFKEKMTGVAATLLEFADSLEEALEKSNANVTTQNPVTASRPLHLKTPSPSS